MSENPFEQTTLAGNPQTIASAFGSTPAAGHGIEVRYPPAIRTLVPGALLLSGIVVPIILFFALPAPMNGLMAAVTAIMELGTAAAFYFFFNSAFVRADETGVTKSQMGKTQTVRWEEIGGIEFSQMTKSPQIKFILRDPNGKKILEFNDMGNKKDGAKLREFIEAQLAKRE